MKTPFQISNAQEVAVWRLCIGCGACAALCPARRIELIDVVEDGIRPVLQGGDCGTCDTCVKVCPGIKAFIEPKEPERARHAAATKWGDFIELWEGFATHPDIRFKGSSGGLCSALSLFCLDQSLAGGVLHVGSDPESPWRNKTYFSKNRDEVVLRIGSRYSPASPCDGLGRMEEAKDAMVFIGKPCDVTGLRLAQRVNPALLNKTALAIGFFCAGTPSTAGTLALLKSHGIDPDSISALRYRGMGWPGLAIAEFKDAAQTPFKLTYEESWGFLQKYRTFRCYLCPDLTAEAADISVGDPWYREVGENEPGHSLILIRTERGREIFQEAMKHGYVTAERCTPDVILKSQGNLLKKRQAIWGRLLAMKLLGIPTPNLKGYPLFLNWLELPLREKIQSVFGTARRIIQRKYFQPLVYDEKHNQWKNQRQ